MRTKSSGKGYMVMQIDLEKACSSLKSECDCGVSLVLPICFIQAQISESSIPRHLHLQWGFILFHFLFIEGISFSLKYAQKVL